MVIVSQEQWNDLNEDEKQTFRLIIHNIITLEKQLPNLSFDIKIASGETLESYP
jgi:hypothetical protein